jgi:phosphoesterase RecJ-like protein
MGTLAEVSSLLKGCSRALICTHISPDPDAIGSSAAIFCLLRQIGISATVYLPEPLPKRFESITSGVSFVHQLPALSDTIEVVLAVDAAALPRLGPECEALKALSKTLINIDHHASNTRYGTCNWVMSDSAASAILVFRLFEALGERPDSVAANLLYAGLLDDTGSFRYSNTNAEAFQVAEKLLSCGAVPEEIANTLYFSVEESVLRLKARAVSELRIELGGQVAFIAVSDAMLKECGARPEDTEGIVDIARSVEGVRAAAFMREMEHGWKVSLRAKDETVDVNAVAALFGGGGHRAAAGCRVEGSLSEVQRQVREALAAALGAS